MRVILCLLIGWAAAGCAQRRTYEVSVTNRLDVAVTIGLVKDGPPYDPEWGTIEQWSMGGAQPDAMPEWGKVIPPGKTAESGPVTSTFERGTGAYLRVYRGERSNAELLAVGGSSPDRVSAELLPGVNRFEVDRDDTRPMLVRRVR